MTSCWRTALVTLIALLGALAMGCNAIMPPPTSTPTATAVPTNTPTPAPTDTPRPSATPTRADALPQAIAISLNKTQSARALRYEFESSVTRVQDGKSEVIPGLSLSGTDSTVDRHVTISGTTSDTNEFITYEVIVHGPDVFIKGLTGVNNVDPKQWYSLPADAQSGVRRLPSALGLLASFDPADFGKAQFQAAGTEALDEQNCSIWSAQNMQYAQNLVGVTEASELKNQLGEIDSAEFKVWTCADGYIHLMNGQVRGHNADKPDDTTTVLLRFAMADFEEPLAIEPPVDAKPFPVQSERPPATTTPASEVPTTATPAAETTESPTAETTETPPEGATATPEGGETATPNP